MHSVSHRPGLNSLLITVLIMFLLSYLSSGVIGLTLISMTRQRETVDFPYTIKCDKPREQQTCHDLCGSDGSCSKIRIDQDVSYKFCNCPQKPTADVELKGYSCAHSKTTKGKCPYVCGGSGSSPYTCQSEDLKNKLSQITKTHCVCVNHNIYRK